MKSTESTGRFLTIAQFAAELNVTESQAYALVRTGQIRAIKVGGRGQWRLERSVIEEFIAGAYKDAGAYVSSHPDQGENADGDLDDEA